MTLNKNELTQIPRIEPRWPAALTVLVALGLLSALPDRIRLFPAWFAHVAAIAPTGYISMLTDYIKPEQSCVTCPNHDTVYGAMEQVSCPFMEESRSPLLSLNRNNDNA